jgi:membrane protease YdiL (CAAX protease family)
LGLPERPGTAVTAAGLLGAYAAFGAVFRGPRERFWTRMTRTGLALGPLALVTEGELRRMRPRWRDVPTGIGIAAGLYAIFTVGDKLARRIMPGGAEDIGEIYELRRHGSRIEIAIRLATVIGPAEELFWRGLVCTELTDRLGPVRGPATATALYGGAHVITGNPTLLGAATVAGSVWTALRAAGVPMPALILSHLLWDVWILLVRPTGAEGHRGRRGAGRATRAGGPARTE